MKQPQTYKLEELHDLSGVKPRTIAYYVEQSLLPKVGRRGRRTRYSQEFLDRLLFIQRVRELQDAGKLRAVTLDEIRDVMDHMPATEIRSASQKRASAESLRALFSEPDRDTSQLAVRAEDVAEMEIDDASMALWATQQPASSNDPEILPASGRRRVMASAPGSDREGREPQSTAMQEEEPELKELLTEIERRSHKGAKSSRGQTREHLTRVPVTETMFLSVQDLDEEGANLVERLAEILRKLGRS